MKHIHFLTLGLLLSLFAVNAQAQNQEQMQRLNAKTAISLQNLEKKPSLIQFNELPIEDYTVEVTTVGTEDDLKTGGHLSLIVKIVAGGVSYAPEELWVNKEDLNPSNDGAPLRIITEDDLKLGNY